MQNAKCRNRSVLRRALFAFCILHFAVLLGACRQKMANQPRYDPLEPSDLFVDGMSARPRIAGTVARGELVVNEVLETGKMGGQDVDGFPVPVTAAMLNTGEERFNIYCSPCHGRAGDGNGMIPSRGYRHPPSFHTETLRTAKTGHFFDVMTNGFGSMPPYAAQVAVNDRWAIIAYIRALQISQHATVNELPPDAKAQLGATQ
jgi:mono/diheme cytochrome c family protein